MTAFPWFRVYNEILNERKIERIRRMTGLPRYAVRGAWVTLLAMANDSPERGCLMWTDELWITEQELCDDLEMDPADFAKLLAAFKTMKMVSEHSDGLSCTNFDKRQFKSDNSTARVKAHRARQRAPKALEETSTSNVSETLLCNAPEADTETESDSEAKTEADPPPHTPAPTRTASFHPAIDVYQEAADYLPPMKWRNTVVDVVGVSKSNVDRWGSVISAWIGMGWNPRNVMGMLDFYGRNEIPGARRSTGPPGGNGQDSLDITLQVVQELEEEERAKHTTATG